MRKTLILFAVAIFLVGMHLPATSHTRAAEPAVVKRPPIVGVAHIGLFVSDLERSRGFYGHVLGFADAFSLDKPTGGLMLTYFKVNDHQYIELFPGLKSPTQDRLSHIAFETTNARQLRDYLAAHGVQVPAELKPGLDGNLSFMVKDPDGHNVEFVQYMPGSLHKRHWGKDMPASRVGRRIIHAGFTVRDRAAADKFYKDILGFHLIWQGGMKDTEIDWVDMQVPDGTDWLEYMLNVHNPSPRTLGVMHHFAIGIQNHEAAYKTVLGRGYKPPEPPKIGRDGKWQINLYDPDLTRAELMEFRPVQPPCCSPMILGPADVIQPAPPKH
jgi:catechol 2,3-dioxygenase-like lactoylglutathione lyase family enzyme